ncbi:hypothetical protein LXD69_07355 [Flavobacterium sediminilitoris]|uniref:Uncharacterized protein n=1 Tax=Flavobacterium sediminilitoris TaxID=2024526 RepID=A0ABY4HRI9_9FLAO|nr:MULTISPECIES: hypothetical protein [Flavobacterium]UOX35328.1 hypothetical protein LXD69_07355 [Flavobacterium sediminilitoris]
MQNTTDRKAGNAAANKLRAAFRTAIKSTFNRRTGKMYKTNVTAKYRSDNLDRLTLTSPRYSFQNHFGSSKTGTTGNTSRSGGQVKSYTRHVNGKAVTVPSFNRSAATVSSHKKNRQYRKYGHLAIAMRASQPALEQLATDLAENRAVVVISKIDF